MHPVSVSLGRVPIEWTAPTAAASSAPVESGRTAAAVFVEAPTARYLPPAAAEDPPLSPIGAFIWCKRLEWCFGRDPSPAIARVLQAIATPPKPTKPPPRRSADESAPATGAIASRHQQITAALIDLQAKEVDIMALS